MTHLPSDPRTGADVFRARRTLRISCEAVPPTDWPAGAQGGTSACRTGAALSFVRCIRLFDGVLIDATPFRPFLRGRS